MLISGLQKLTLLDYPGHTACTVFTGGCNLRCPFCQNSGLLTGEGERIPESELLAFLKKRQGILDGVCITGGEPLLQPDMEEFCQKIREIGLAIKAIAPEEKILVSELTNGSVGYCCPDSTLGSTAYGGRYYSGRLGYGAKDTMTAAAKALVEKLG